jgi:hypothetical protein
MCPPLDPIDANVVADAKFSEDPAAYESWFRAQVEAALRSTKPRLGHAEAMARVEAELSARRQSRACDPLVRRIDQ